MTPTILACSNSAQYDLIDCPACQMRPQQFTREPWRLEVEELASGACWCSMPHQLELQHAKESRMPKSTQTEYKLISALPLDQAEHHFLQVLLPSFEIERITEGPAPGIHLSAAFDNNMRALWRRQQRVLVQDAIENFESRAAEIDHELDQFLNDPKQLAWKFSDSDFVFRYGNGGTLPIIRMGSAEYYCLPFRDIPPIGWNLANGASDSRFELFNPMATVERELKEEILIVDERKGIRYALQWEEDDTLERPEFLMAREYWKSKRGIDIGNFKEQVAPVTWIYGSDAITLNSPGQLGRCTEGVFINISAADFGIEIDRIAKIHVDAGVTVLDGEIYSNTLVDRPMGLFEVSRFVSAFRNGAEEFVPDILFVSGERFEGTPADISAKINQACSSGNRPLRSKREDAEWDRCDTRLKLCPVTRQLAARHLAQEALFESSLPSDHPNEEPFDVFISTTGHGEDIEIAQEINAYLTKDRSVGPVFYYKETPKSMDWLRMIENALLTARSLIVVCTDVSRVRSLDFEWQPYFLWTRYGRKRQGQIIPVVRNIMPHDLPLPLCSQDAVYWSTNATKPLESLGNKIRLGVG